MSKERIRTVIDNLQIHDGRIAGYLQNACLPILSQQEALTGGHLLIREKAGLVTISNSGSQPALLLAGEPLIGEWQTRETLLAPPNFALYLSPGYLTKVKLPKSNKVHPPWQEGCIGLASSKILEILPTPHLAAQLWPILVAKQAQDLIFTSAEKDFLAQLGTLQIEQCFTVGAGEAYCLSGSRLKGRALVFGGQLVHLYLAKLGDDFEKADPQIL